MEGEGVSAVITICTVANFQAWNIWATLLVFSLFVPKIAKDSCPFGWVNKCLEYCFLKCICMWCLSSYQHILEDVHTCTLTHLPPEFQPWHSRVQNGSADGFLIMALPERTHKILLSHNLDHVFITYCHLSVPKKKLFYPKVLVLLRCTSKLMINIHFVCWLINVPTFFFDQECEDNLDFSISIHRVFAGGFLAFVWTRGLSPCFGSLHWEFRVQEQDFA